MNQFSSPASHPARAVRVFISSTFRDMHAERDHLVTVVFPELRERLERLGLEFFDVDLRWGVPETGVDGERANTWEYCKRWIDRIEPFFICLLGQRYGWRPPTAEVGAEGDRTKYAGLSITEMEIRYGVLEGRLRRRSFFYFRRDRVPETAPPEIYRQFVDPDEQERLRALKAEVVASGRPARLYDCRWTGADFEVRDESGRLLLEDLWSGVLRDDRFVSKDAWRSALGQHPDDHPLYADDATPLPRDVWERVVEQVKPLPRAPLEADADEMARHAARLLRPFRGRERELEELRRFVYDPQPAQSPRLCVIRGPPGQGKSALLARLADLLSCDTASPPIVISHFVGATARSTAVRWILERLNLELDRHQVPPLTEDLPPDDEGLRRRLAVRLADYQQEQTLVLLIDGVDQTLGGHDLSGLPFHLGPRVRVILTFTQAVGAALGAAEGRVTAALEAREPPPRWLDLPPLADAEAREVTRSFLAEYCKVLEPDDVAAIAALPQARNPLYLLVLLRELRTLGGENMHLLVRRIIADLGRLRPEIASLFEWVLERLEVFGKEAVREWLATLALAQTGLSSRELSEILEFKLGPAGARASARIERALRGYLQRSGPCWTFFHAELRRAVERRYVPPDPAPLHADLAIYFGSRWREDRHALEELVFQETHARQWNAVYRLLTSFEFLEARCATERIDPPTGHVLLIVEDLATPTDLACPGCGQWVDPSPLRHTRMGRLVCGRCRMLTRYVVRRHFAREDLEECHSVPCGKCGQELQVSRRWFAGGVRTARWRCARCDALCTFSIPEPQGEPRYRGLHVLREDYALALAKWPAELPDEGEVLRSFAAGLGHCESVLSKRPEELFPQLYPHLWWGPAAVQAQLRTLCDGHRVAHTSRGPWLRRLDRPVSTAAMGLRLAGLPPAREMICCDARNALVIGSTERALVVVDLATGDLSTTQVGHDSVHIHPAEDQLTLVCGSGQVYAYRFASAEVRHLFDLGGPPSAAGISGDGRLLALGSAWGQVELWDVAAASELKRHLYRRAAITHVAFSGDGRELLAVNAAGSCFFYDVAGFSMRLRTFPIARPRALLPDAQGGGWWWIGFDAAVHRLRRGDAEPVSFARLPGERARATATSRSGSALAVGCESGLVVAWKSDRPSEPVQFHLSQSVSAVAISGDLELIIAADQAGNYEVHRVSELLSAPEEARGLRPVTRPAHVPDPSALVVGCIDGRARIPNEGLGDARLLPGRASFEGAAAAAIAGSVWAATTAGGSWKAWDVRSVRELGGMGAARASTAIAVSPAGDLVATGHDNGWGVVWDAFSGAERSRARLHGGRIRDLAFTPDGRLLVSAGEDGFVRAWNMSVRVPGERLTLLSASAEVLSGLELRRCWEAPVDAVALSCSRDASLVACAGLQYLQEEVRQGGADRGRGVVDVAHLHDDAGVVPRDLLQPARLEGADDAPSRAQELRGGRVGIGHARGINVHIRDVEPSREKRGALRLPRARRPLRAVTERLVGWPGEALRPQAGDEREEGLLLGEEALAQVHGEPGIGERAHEPLLNGGRPLRARPRAQPREGLGEGGQRRRVRGGQDRSARARRAPAVDGPPGDKRQQPLLIGGSVGAQCLNNLLDQAGLRAPGHPSHSAACRADREAREELQPRLGDVLDRGAQRVPASPLATLQGRLELCPRAREHRGSPACRQRCEQPLDLLAELVGARGQAQRARGDDQPPGRLGRELRERPGVHAGDEQSRERRAMLHSRARQRRAGEVRRHRRRSQSGHRRRAEEEIERPVRPVEQGRRGLVEVGPPGVDRLDDLREPLPRFLDLRLGARGRQLRLERPGQGIQALELTA
jgi:WD40 repeat protein